MAVRAGARGTANGRSIVPHASVQDERSGENADAFGEIVGGAGEFASSGLGDEDAVRISLAERRRGVRSRGAIRCAGCRRAEPNAVLLRFAKRRRAGEEGAGQAAEHPVAVVRIPDGTLWFRFASAEIAFGNLVFVKCLAASNA